MLSLYHGLCAGGAYGSCFGLFHTASALAYVLARCPLRCAYRPARCAHTARNNLPTAHSPLPTANSPLPTPHSPLPTSHSNLKYMSDNCNKTQGQSPYCFDKGENN